jgi:2-aminoadipate transaminase
MNKDWTDRFAHRTSEMKESEVRALFAVVNRVNPDGTPQVISLAGGMPYVQALSTDVISEVQTRLLKEKGGIALQYGSGQGNPILREQITTLMAEEGINANPDNIIVTTGSQSGLDLISKMFLDGGNVVLVESPSYVGALGVFKSYQADIEHVYSDESGINPEALKQKILDLERIGKRIKFLYLVPNYSNPTGYVLPLERRKAVIEICKQHNILVVEDDPYGLLYFDGAPPPSIISLTDTENVVYLGSFSKTFAPGFRIGWMHAPKDIKKVVVLANEAAVLSPSEFSQMTISEYLKHTDWKMQLDMFRNLYRERRDVMMDALDEHLPDLVKTRTQGGFFSWLKLPEHVNSKLMLPQAVENGVAYTPGTAFYADGRGKNELRLNFSYPQPFYIEKGIQLLADTIKNYKE